MRKYTKMVVAAVCLGTIGVLVKSIGHAVPPMTLNFYRMFFGFIFLVVAVPMIDRNAFRITLREGVAYFRIGILMAISLSLYTTANLYAPIQNVVLINYTYPFFILIYAALTLNEHITKTKVVTLVFAVIGLAIINPFKAGADNLGNTMSMVGALFYAVLITEMRRQGMKHDIGDVIWFLFFGSLVLAPAPFIWGFGELGSVFWLVLALGFVSTGMAYLFYNLALERLEAELCAITATIITPLVSIILAVVFIGEILSARTLIGGIILILAGIYLQTHMRQLRQTIL